MRAFGYRVIDLLVDHFDGLADRPIGRKGNRAALEAALREPIPEAPGNPESILARLRREVFSNMLHVDHPRFFSFVPAPGNFASAMADALIGGLNVFTGTWFAGSGPAQVELVVVDWLRQICGLPESAGGLFVSGGSMANLTALAVARHARLGEQNAGAIVYTSDQTHSSVRNALRILDMESFLVSTENHRLTGESLNQALADDSHSEDVVAVVATAGTTNAGIVDDLTGIAQVAAERDLWFHVDGAYGAGALLAPSARHLFAGIERADSFVVDPHKWLFAPFDCAALIYRQPALAKAVHTQQASYLDIFHVDDGWNPSDYAYHLTRRARGLALWFSLAVHGIDAYGVAVEAALDMARQAAERIELADHVELAREPGLSIVLFRRLGWEAADYQRWSHQLLADQIGFVTPTAWEGETMARFAFLHPDTTIEMVDEILATMV